MAWVWDLACKIICNLTHYQLVPGNILVFWHVGHKVRVQNDCKATVVVF